MTRRKVKLAFIENNSDRKASYKKRKRGLMKKVQELSTLCGVDACAILYGAFDNEPEVWPSNPAAMNHVLTRFKDLPETEKVKRMVNQEVFMKHRVDKMNEQLKKLRRDNRELLIADFVNQCLSGNKSVENFNLSDLIDMGWLIERKLKEIDRRMANLKKCNIEGAPPGMNMPVEKDTNFNGGGVVVDGVGDSYSSLLNATPYMPVIDGHSMMQNITWEMGMLSTNEHHPKSDYFLWDYNPFLDLPISNNNNGASSTYHGFPNYYVDNNGAGPSFSGYP